MHESRYKRLELRIEDCIEAKVASPTLVEITPTIVGWLGTMPGFKVMEGQAPAGDLERRLQKLVDAKEID